MAEAPVSTGTLDLRHAITEAIGEELEHDETVIFFGEDVAAPGGVFATTQGLHERFGDERVFDTPISELALSGAAFGSAVAGLRPIVEIMFGDFLMLAMDSMVNQSAKFWYVSNEQGSVPLVIRSAVGGGIRFGAIHSQMPISWFMGVPGLKIVAPSSANDAKRLLKASVRDDNPVLFLEHKALYGISEPREPGAEAVEELGRARIVRRGADVTLVSCMRGVHDCLAAAELLVASGVDAEVVDLRTIRPLDTVTILESVSRTHRLLAVEEGPITGGWAGEVMAVAAESALDEIDTIWRLATPDRPIPFSPKLEDAFFPTADSIAESVLDRLKD